MGKITKKEQKEIRKQEKLQYQIELDKQQQKKKFMVWGGVAAAIIISIFGLIKLANISPSSSSVSQTAKVAPLTKDDIAAGNKNAKAILVEYADFQCPGCAAMHPLLKQLFSDEGDKVRFVYRFFPLTQIHKNAMLSAEAAYAAYLQGKFFEMHDMLYDNQTTWAESDDAKSIFQGYAKKLNLNMDTFNSSVDADSTQKFINDEESVGSGNGINHTPTLYLNNREIDDQVRTYDDLKRLVDQAK